MGKYILVIFILLVCLCEIPIYGGSNTYADAISPNGAKILQKDYSGAIQDLTEAIESDSKDYSAYFTRGLAKSLQGNFSDATQDYSKAIEIKPKLSIAYSFRGIAKEQLTDYKEAILDFNKALELDPKDAQAFYGRGFAESELQDYKSSISDFNRAIELKPNNIKAYFSRGIAKLALGDKKGAIWDLSKCIELNPKYPDAYLIRGLIKKELGDQIGAIEDYTKGVELDPNLMDQASKMFKEEKTPAVPVEQIKSVSKSMPDMQWKQIKIEGLCSLLIPNSLKISPDEPISEFLKWNDASPFGISPSQIVVFYPKSSKLSIPFPPNFTVAKAKLNMDIQTDYFQPLNMTKEGLRKMENSIKALYLKDDEYTFNEQNYKIKLISGPKCEEARINNYYALKLTYELQINGTNYKSEEYIFPYRNIGYKVAYQYNSSDKDIWLDTFQEIVISIEFDNSSSFTDYMESVVVIDSKKGFGSGFFISQDGYIVTNSHVVDTDKEVSVKLYNKKTIAGKVIANNSDIDLAIVKIDGNSYSKLTLATPSETQIGDDVIAIGTPSGLDWSVSKGIISSVRHIDDLTLIQTDVAINSGNSGGPLIDTKTGKVIGINSFKLSKSEGLNFAISASEITSTFPELIKKIKK